MFSEDSVKSQKEYIIFWYDAKMKNYLNLLEFLNNRRLVQAKVTAILVVDKREIAENVEKIKEGAADMKLKK